MAATDDPVLTRFHAALDAAYGDRVERVVLFGSRARGDHRPDSDYDVAVSLRGIGGVGEEIRRLVDLADPILVDTGAVISAVALPEGSHREWTGFMAEVRREGTTYDAGGRGLTSHGPAKTSARLGLSRPCRLRAWPRGRPISQPSTPPRP